MHHILENPSHPQLFKALLLINPQLFYVAQEDAANAFVDELYNDCDDLLFGRLSHQRAPDRREFLPQRAL